MNATRIALVSEHASPLAVLGGVDAGGQNVHVAALATGLARLGYEVTVHTRRDDPDLADRVELGPGVVVDHVTAGPPTPVSKDELFSHMPSFAHELAGRWRTERPHVVHTHFWMSGWAGLRARRRLDLPLVHTFHALGVVKRRHQGPLDASPSERIAAERTLMRRADRIIATCSDEVFEIRQLGGEAPVSIVPCGVDPVAFRTDGPAEWRPAGSPRHRVVVVGRLVARKGVAEAIAAVAELPDVELVVAGGPGRDDRDTDPEIARLRAVAEAHGIADRVDLRGRIDRPDLPGLLRSADAVVCVPWYEPFGIVPLEAMACGVPVVASAVGGLADTVVDGVTGVHVRPRDPAGLAEALRGLLADPARRAAMGRAGRRRVRGRYAWERVASATAEVYDDVLSGRSRDATGGRGRAATSRPVRGGHRRVVAR